MITSANLWVSLVLEADELADKSQRIKKIISVKKLKFFNTSNDIYTAFS